MFKKTSLLILTVFTLFLNSAFALDKTLVLGGKDGWPRLSRMDGVVLGKGKFGYGAMVLATNSRRLDSDTDILVNFEGGTVKDESGNYKVVTNAIVPSSKSYMGKYSGLALGKGGVSLSGKDGGLLFLPSCHRDNTEPIITSISPLVSSFIFFE